MRRLIRRFARAGDADDCGHHRHGGLFTPKNTCAAGEGGEEEGTSEGGSGPALLGDRGTVAQFPMGSESDRRLIDAARRLIDAKAAADEPRKHSNPPPTVMSPGPFEPDEPIRRRIANLPGAREMLAEIIDKLPPYHDRLKKDESDLRELDDQLIAAMYKNPNDPNLERLLAVRDRIKDSIDSSREKMSEVISSLTGHKKDVRFRSVDGMGDWNDENEPARKRHQALSWLQSSVAGRGDIKVKWNNDENSLRPGAITQILPYQIDVNSITSDTRVYVHEMGHVIERAVAGVREAAREFLEYRTRNTPDRPLREMYPGPIIDKEQIHLYEENEIGNEDDFGELYERAGYIGRKYSEDDEMTEIVSVGLHILYENPVHFARVDPEYCTFILGILRGDLRSPDRNHHYT